MKKKNENRSLYAIIGIFLLALGLYFVSENIIVRTGFYQLHFGRHSLPGLIVVPFIVGVILMFVYPDKFISKIAICLGILIIFASVIAGTTFIFRSTSLFNYLLMLIGIFGGVGLLIRFYLTRTK